MSRSARAAYRSAEGTLVCGSPPPAAAARVTVDGVLVTANGLDIGGKEATKLLPVVSPTWLLLMLFVTPVGATAGAGSRFPGDEKTVSKLAKFPFAENAEGFAGAVGVELTEAGLNGSLLKAPKMSTFDLNMGWLVVVVATADEMGVGQVAELGVVGWDL